MSGPTTTAVRSTVNDRRKFAIHRCLGRGGFGEVYQATMTAAGVTTEVAVKILHKDLDPRSQSVQRLRDEGRLLGVLNHPAILRTSGLVLVEGRIALVTEFVDGSDLEYCTAGDHAMEPRALVEVMGKVADALHAAYTTPGPGGGPLGLVHRDVKPANVRIGRHGEVKLLDFGIARAKDDRREAKTQAHALIGSLLFMAPERLDDEATADTAGDVYALGCTFFDGLAHSHLFDGQSMKAMCILAVDGVRHDVYVDERFKLLADVPEPVVALLRRMVSFKAADRPTMAEISSQCEELGETLPGPTLRAWCRAHTWQSAEVVPGDLDGREITEQTGITDWAETLATTGSVSTKKANTNSADTFTISADAASRSPASGAPVDAAAAPGSSRAALVAIPAVLAVVAVVLVVVVVVGGIALASMQTTDAPVVEAPPVVEPPPVPRPVVEAPVEPPPPVTPPEPPPVVETTTPPPPEPPPVAVTPPPTTVVKPKPVEPPPVVAPPVVETAAPTTGGFAVSGAIPARIDGVHDTKAVTPGTYTVMADFGDGWQAAGEVTIAAGATTTVKCSRILMKCSVAQ